MIVKNDVFSRDCLDKHLSPAQRHIVSLAYIFNGYVAGGFAASLIKSIVYDINTRFINRCNDIDLWFSTKDDYLKFYVSIMNNKNLKILKSFGGCAIDILENSNYVKKNIQVINKFFEEPEIRISNFDFANCQAAFNDKVMIYNDDIIKIHHSGEIKIIKANSNFLLSRIAKYLQKEPNKDITKCSIPIVLDYIQSRIEKGDESPGFVKKVLYLKTSPDAYNLNHALGYFTIDQIKQASKKKLDLIDTYYRKV